MRLLIGKPCLFIVRNFTQDSEHMKAKITRFNNEYKEHMKREVNGIEVVDAVTMSLCKTGIKNAEKIYDAIKSPKLIIALSNGTQLKCINIVLDNIKNETNIDPELAIYIDEADSIGYSEIKEPKPPKHASEEFQTLRLRCNQFFEISATVWDILGGNTELANTNIVIIRPPPTYKGIKDGIQYKVLVHPIEKWNKDIDIRDADANIVDVYKELMNICIFKTNRYNCEINHPVIILHKTNTFIKHHVMFFDLFMTDSTYNKTWTVITECSKGMYVFSDNLRGNIIKINSKVIRDNNNDGKFYFGDRIIIPQLLQWFIDNGGADRFHHIVIKSGHFSGRSRSYVSTNGVWHLTHQYYGGGKNIPSIIQAQRLIHDRPDSIPLIEYAPLKTIKDIKRGDMIQDEQIQRLLNIQHRVHTYKQIREEVWSKDKVPKSKLCTGKVNSSFKVKSIQGVDGGWDIQKYQNEPIIELINEPWDENVCI